MTDEYQPHPDFKESRFPPEVVVSTPMEVRHFIDYYNKCWKYKDDEWTLIPYDPADKRIPHDGWVIACFRNDADHMLSFVFPVSATADLHTQARSMHLRKQQLLRVEKQTIATTEREQNERMMSRLRTLLIYP